jgi:tetratricopeptide (TPR) repeat protein
VLREAQQRHTEAHEAAERATSIQPNYAAAIWFSIGLYRDEGKTADATKLAENAIAQNLWPAEVKDLQWLFDQYALEKNSTAGIALLDKSVLQYQSTTSFLFNAAKVYIQFGYPDKARTLLVQLQAAPRGVSLEEVNQLLQDLPK